MDRRPIPYGYRLDKTTDALTPDPVEAPLVRQMFTAYADARQGTRAIATGLNQRGIATRSGKPWSGYTIGRILANRVYAGEKVFGDITVPDAHPALVDPDLFARGPTHPAPCAERPARNAPPSPPTTT